MAVEEQTNIIAKPGVTSGVGARGSALFLALCNGVALI